MGKFKITMVLITVVCLLNGCTVFGGRMARYNNYDREADARFEKVVDAIKNKDKDALKSMFSKQAINASDDLDGNLDHLFEFIQGEIGSWKSEGSYGLIGTKVSSYYYVTTDKGKYFFLIDDYTLDTDHPDNVGLYLMLVVRAEDKEKIWDENNKIIYDKVVEDGKEKLVKIRELSLQIIADTSPFSTREIKSIQPGL